MGHSYLAFLGAPTLHSYLAFLGAHIPWCPQASLDLLCIICSSSTSGISRHAWLSSRPRKLKPRATAKGSLILTRWQQKTNMERTSLIWHRTSHVLCSICTCKLKM